MKPRSVSSYSGNSALTVAVHFYGFGLYTFPISLSLRTAVSKVIAVFRFGSVFGLGLELATAAVLIFSNYPTICGRNSSQLRSAASDGRHFRFPQLGPAKRSV